MPKLVETIHVKILKDRANALFNQEQIYINRNYLSHSADRNNSQVVDEDCRKIMAQWCYRIASHCNFSPDTACIAMCLMDRFLSTEKGNLALCEKLEFQLATVCCLHITVKMHETRNLDMSTLKKLCRGFYNAEEFTRMECIIFTALKWRLCPPTPYAFLELFFELLPPSNNIDSCKQYIRELAHKQILASVQDYSLVTVSPSSIAISSLLNALDQIQLPLHSFISFFHNIHVATGIDCTNQLVVNLKHYLISIYHAQDGQSNTIDNDSDDTTCNTSSVHDCPTTTSPRLRSPVCIGNFED